jgi:tRNA 2-thiocytidine biosynthesis protein TtcA
LRDFQMIDDQDVIAVALSGGKDSIVLHDLLVNLARRAPIQFSVIGLHVAQGMPGHDLQPLVSYMELHDLPLHIQRDPTYPALRPLIAQGKNPCPLCSRLRRAILYRAAAKLGCTKLARAPPTGCPLDLAAQPRVLRPAQVHASQAHLR